MCSVSIPGSSLKDTLNPNYAYSELPESRIGRLHCSCADGPLFSYYKLGLERTSRPRSQALRIIAVRANNRFASVDWFVSIFSPLKEGSRRRERPVPETAGALLETVSSYVLSVTSLGAYCRYHSTQQHSYSPPPPRGRNSIQEHEQLFSV